MLSIQFGLSKFGQYPNENRFALSLTNAVWY